jgi:xanthine dehydrogenase YagS FAD-binding subunit
MRPFILEQPRDLRGLLDLSAQSGRNDSPIEYIAGGTDMVQLLQEGVRQPSRLVSLAGLLDKQITVTARGLHLGAGATMADVAAHPQVASEYPVIAEALLDSASPQVRNQASIGGNLLQRTRCPYFRDTGYAACNKRSPGTGCSAIGGENRWNAILGGSDACIATHPSDLAVALVALDAVVQIQGSRGERQVALANFHRLPGRTPHIEAELRRGEVISAVSVPAHAVTRRSHYLKVRDRASFEFALVSAAVGLDMQQGQIRQARVACGGVGTKPWRLRGVEAALAGASLDRESLRRAAARAAESAQGRGHNDFKIELMQRTIVRAIEIAGARA